MISVVGADSGFDIDSVLLATSGSSNLMNNSASSLLHFFTAIISCTFVPPIPAPDFTLNDMNGAQVRLSDFKGRKVVLQFWASWCPDCRAEIPVIKKMQASADPSEIVFVAVSFDRSEEAFSSYVTKNAMGGVQLYDPAGMRDSAIAAAYHITWIPSLYLIDENGKVSLATVMVDKLEKAVDKK